MRDRSTMTATGGRSSRGGGKRGGGGGASSATASASLYYATTGLLVALCLAGAYFLTSTSAASVAGDGEAAGGTVTAYRHTTRSSFAYEVARENKSPSPPREVVQEAKADNGGSNNEEKEDDPHAKPDDHEVVEDESPTTNSNDNKEDALDAHGGVEEQSSVSVLEEESVEEQREQDRQPHEAAVAVEEKSLDGGIEEESNVGQRLREEEEPLLRREAQEETAGVADERPLEEEERQPDQEEEQPQNQDSSSSSMEGQQDENGSSHDDDHKAWATQAEESHREKDLRREESNNEEEEESSSHEWRLCNVKAGADYIPCLDNDKAIKKLRPENYRRYEHRERHCPEEGPTCLVPLPAGYRRPVEWPKSRDRIWYNNVPHTKLVEVKGHQNWVKVSGKHLTFPGGGTQFIHGALHYIDFLQQSVRGISWGKHTRVVLDVGCGVASFGGYLFERDVVTMSFAPKDEHEAQVQMALERGIPAISAVMGSKRLPFPSKAFDLVHCARCRVPWHADGGALLLELNRVLRPGGFFVWSATPVYQKLTEDVQIWKAMSALTRSMCWDLVSIKKDRLNGVGIAFYRKPTSNDCYDGRKRQQPPMCSDDDDANAAWYIRLNSCMHRAPVSSSERGTTWPLEWPRRVRTPPYWLNNTSSLTADAGKDDDFTADYDRWRRIVDRSYLNGLGIDWARVRNVMDMRATYGGFAAALKEKKIWVMNVVNVDAPDTLPIIFERGLLGIYHDWCESFSTYPRTYDLLHADHLFSKIKDRCALLPVVVEVDRIVRPGGSIILRDEAGAIAEVEKLLKSLHWDVRLTFSQNDEGVLYAEKSNWRPELIDEPS